MTAQRQNVVTYREVQRLTHPLLWAFVLALSAFAWWIFLQQVVFSRPFGTNPAPNVLVIIFAVAFGAAFPLFFLALNLRVEVHSDIVRLRFFPLWSRSIPIADIEDCQPRTYRPLAEYGGWGIRWSPRGWAYNVKGNRGVQLTLRSGRPILIGTQSPEQLAAAINAARKLSPSSVDQASVATPV